MKSSDVISLCAFVVALGSAVSEPGLEAVFPGHGAYIASVLSLAGIVAGAIIRTLTNKTGAPASAVIADAAIVSPGTDVVSSSTPVLATNISSTSQLLPGNVPAKGTP